MDQQKYIGRIGYSGPLEATLEALRGLQRAHLLHIPFENLDISYGIPIELDIDKIFTKIVLHERGGFCYELNGLFYELLVSLGFPAKRISARVFDQKTGRYGQEFDHLAIIVAIDDEEYLADVGFGEFAFAPLKLQLGALQHDERGVFMIEKHDGDYFRVNKKDGGAFKPEYIFKNTERQFAAFREMCRYHQASPDSHFTRQRLISRPTPQGRITLAGDKLKIQEVDTVVETHLEDEDSFRRKLSEYFGIEL